MNRLRARLEHLPADVLGLTGLERAVYAGSPPSGLDAPRSLDGLRPRERADPLVRPSPAALGSALETQLARYEPPVAVLDSVRRLAQPGASVVVAGARTGLLGGPLTNLWAGLHVVRLARALEAQGEAPVLPMLWMRGEAEPWTAHAKQRLLDSNYDHPQVGLQLPAGDADAAVGALRLDPERHGLGSLRAQLRSHFDRRLGSEAWFDALLPRSGETLTRATARGLTLLLGELGVVVVEPRALRGATTRLLAELLGEIPAPAQVDAEDAPTLELGPAWLHRVEQDRAFGLVRGGDGFRYTSESGSRRPTELAAELVQEPRAWIPGDVCLSALLRRLLPVAAQLVAPDELEHAAALTALGLPTPPLVPLLRGTLFEPGSRRSLERLSWSSGHALREAARWSEAASAVRTAKAPRQVTPGPGAALRREGERTRAAAAGPAPRRSGGRRGARHGPTTPRIPDRAPHRRARRACRAGRSQPGRHAPATRAPPRGEPAPRRGSAGRGPAAPAPADPPRVRLDRARDRRPRPAPLRAPGRVSRGLIAPAASRGLAPSACERAS